MLSCIILVLLGMLLGIMIYMLCMRKKQAVDHVSTIGLTSRAVSKHSYETIKPLCPHQVSLGEETGFIEDPYIPNCEPETLYYKLEEDDNYGLGQMSCNCQGACNCSAYA